MKISLKNRLFFILGLWLVCSFRAEADTVYLKNGGQVNGIVKSESSEGVVVSFSFGGEMTIEHAEIDSISYSDKNAKATLKNQWKAEQNASETKRKVLNSRKSNASSSTPLKGKLKPIRIFVTDWCGYCRKLEALFKANGLDYEECNIEQSAACKSEYLHYGKGYKGVPLTVIGNMVIRGYDPARIETALRHPSARE